MAAGIDFVVAFLGTALIGKPLGLGIRSSRYQLYTSAQIVNRLLVDLVVILVVDIVVLLACELMFRRSIGKAVLNLRVMDVTGSPATARQILVRNVLRIIDILPAFYLVGMITVATNTSGQGRLGDLAADTSVMRTRSHRPPAPQQSTDAKGASNVVSLPATEHGRSAHLVARKLTKARAHFTTAC